MICDLESESQPGSIAATRARLGAGFPIWDGTYG